MSFFEENNKSSLKAERKKELEAFCKNLNIRFKNLDLLNLALTHRSYSNENSKFHDLNNEKLEFLGDSVLGLATAAFLYKDVASAQEGTLARIKASVVSEQTLAPIAAGVMKIPPLLVMGRGEEMSGGRQKKAILADAVEAVIGALYVDSGYKAAEKLVLELIVPEIRKVQKNTGNKDYKTVLQEYYQKKYKECPKYELVKTYGPECDKTFEVKVHLGDLCYGPAEGKSKKSAEQNAARIACSALKIKV